MLKLPEKINQPFQQLLIHKGLVDKDSRFYSKWLCLYWDFCHKYHHPAFGHNSLPLFLTKLQTKGQSEAQRMQASRAIYFLYEISSAAKVNKSNTLSETSSLPSSPDQVKDNGSSTHSLHSNHPTLGHGIFRVRIKLNFGVMLSLWFITVIAIHVFID